MAHTFTGRKPAGFIATVYCAACYSPILPCAGTKVQKSECFHDAAGYHWCPEHAERGKLLNWAQANGYPAIEFRGESGLRYAIGFPEAKQATNEEWWTLAIIAGNDDALRAAARSVGVTASQDEGAML